MGNDNGIGLSPSPWLPSGSPSLPLSSARFMPPTPALEFPPMSADLSLGIPSPSYPGNSIMSPSVTGFVMSTPMNPSRRNSLKSDVSNVTTSAALSNPLESFADGAGGYDPPSTTPTPGPEGKSSQTHQPQSMSIPTLPASSAAIAAAVSAPRPPPKPTTSAAKPSQQVQQMLKRQPSILRKNSLVSGAQPPQQPSYGKYAASGALPTNSAALAAVGWVTGGQRKSSMGLLPSPPAINAFGATGTTPAPGSLPMMAVPGLDPVGSGGRMYNSAIMNSNMMQNAANGMLGNKPLTPAEAQAVAACKERAARIGDEFARKRKMQMEVENKRNPKKIKIEKRPEEMTKEELKKKSYAHRLYLNRQSAAVSRVRRQAYVRFLEESLTDIEQSKYRQEDQISTLREENAKLKAHLQSMHTGVLGGKSQGSTFLGGIQKNNRYSRRR